MPDWRSMILGFLFVLAWSSAFTSARIVVADAPPFLALSFRFLISGVIALAIGLAAGQRIRLTKSQWIGVLVFGLCQNALYLGLNFEAMQTIEAGLASIIASMLPLIVAALGRAFFGERLTPLAMAGLVIGFSGVVYIMQARMGASADIYGLSLCLIGVLALSIATLLVRGVSVGGNLWMVVGLQMLVGSFALFPVSVALETWEINWTWPLFWAFLYTTLIPGVAATMIWFILVGRIGAVPAATFHFLNPFLGVFIAFLILGEPITLTDFIGVVIIMIGILAVQLSKRHGNRAV
ncbi:DMT family transporter [Amaricoccus tamworthensis]|uniref:DMT family transporter n=1 Tax=Amaricoccus tamworthensis TaxID=57002 RepID=UPI003C7BBB1B